ncbi:MAG: hypothetical protein VKK04_07285 [Synechococcales bacterium]|nr:hypothetical protein [Synechococcales bacterium]
MKLQEKVLRTAREGKRERLLCLVIPLGQGARVQYPVRDRQEARAIYNEFRALNGQLPVSRCPSSSFRCR